MKMTIQKDMINEIKRRFKKDECSFTRFSGCYVVAGEKKMQFEKNFLNLDDAEFYKYLELAKKVLSGKTGNNLLGLPFDENSNQGNVTKQQLLLGIRDDGLKNRELLDVLYDNIISGMGTDSNYIILLFHDMYDVITKTSDESKLDESEEVFSYLLCAVCPLALSKAGLCYDAEADAIVPVKQQLVVGAPVNGFMYPSFIGRSADVNTVTFYTKDTKNVNEDFISEALGCTTTLTDNMKKEIIEIAITENTDISNVLEKVQVALSNEMQEQEDMVIDDVCMRNVLEDAGVEKNTMDVIVESMSRALHSEKEQFIKAKNVVTDKDIEKAVNVLKGEKIAKYTELLQKALKEIKELAGKETELCNEIRESVG